MKLDNIRVITHLLAIVVINATFPRAIALMGPWRRSPGNDMPNAEYETVQLPAVNLAADDVVGSGWTSVFLGAWRELSPTALPIRIPRVC